MIAYVLFALYFLWHFLQNYVSSRRRCCCCTACIGATAGNERYSSHRSLPIYLYVCLSVHMSVELRAGGA